MTPEEARERIKEEEAKSKKKTGKSVEICDPCLQERRGERVTPQRKPPLELSSAIGALGGDCEMHPFVSRCCERGTPGCPIRHTDVARMEATQIEGFVAHRKPIELFRSQPREVGRTLAEASEGRSMEELHGGVAHIVIIEDENSGDTHLMCMYPDGHLGPVRD